MSKVNQLEFDIRKIKAAKNTEGIVKLQSMFGKKRFAVAWTEIEKDPIEAALIATLYCSDWEDFCSLTRGYGVSKEQSEELNQQFRQRLKEKGLDAMVAMWYQQREVAA